MHIELCSGLLLSFGVYKWQCDLSYCYNYSVVFSYEINMFWCQTAGTKHYIAEGIDCSWI